MFNRQEKNITDSEVKRKLPTNRKEVFFDLLKYRKMNMFALSCFVFMFFIPLAVDFFLFNYLETLAISADKSDYLFSLVFYSMLIMIPCMMIGFIGLIAGFYVAKKMVWQEGTMLAVDFFQGIKENWKHAVINGLLFALILFGLVMGSSYLLIYQKAQPVLTGIGIGALVLLFLTFGMVIALNCAQDVYYVNSYGVTLKNSFCLLGLLHWRILLIFILSTGATFTLCCFNLITMAIGLFLFAVLNSVIIILYTLVSHFGFDKYINLEHYPDYVNKGLYKIETNDKEA